jgi:hypothetical protein
MAISAFLPFSRRAPNSPAMGALTGISKKLKRNAEPRTMAASASATVEMMASHFRRPEASENI